MEREEHLELLSAYADGELDDEELELVEKLLQTDKDAAFESTQIARMKRLIERWNGIRGSGRVGRTVLEQVRHKKPGAAASGFVSFFLGVAAAFRHRAHIGLLEKHIQIDTRQQRTLHAANPRIHIR